MQFRISKHAQRRMAEMGISSKELTETLRFPEEVTEGVKYDDLKYRRGRLTLSVSRDGVVITMLWRDRFVRDRNSATYRALCNAR